MKVKNGEHWKLYVRNGHLVEVAGEIHFPKIDMDEFIKDSNKESTDVH